MMWIVRTVLECPQMLIVKGRKENLVPFMFHFVLDLSG